MSLIHTAIERYLRESEAVTKDETIILYRSGKRWGKAIKKKGGFTVFLDKDNKAFFKGDIEEYIKKTAF